MQYRKTILSSAAIALAAILLAGCVPGLNLPGVNSNTTPTATQAPSGNTGTNPSTGSTKSVNWPSDIPTIDGAYDFTYAKAGDTYYLGFKIDKNSNIKTEAGKEADLLKAAGWSSDANSTFESDTSYLTSLTKGSMSLVLTFSPNDDSIGVGIIAGPKTATTPNTEQ